MELDLEKLSLTFSNCSILDWTGCAGSLERDMKEPDRIVGELMQPGGVDALTKLGLAWTLEDIDAAGCAGYAVINGKEDVVLRYPQEEAKEVKGWSFHHGRFISQLRKAAAMEKKWVT